MEFDGNNAGRQLSLLTSGKKADMLEVKEKYGGETRLKSQLIDYMKERGIKSLSDGQGKYWILKKGTSKISMTEEFLSSAYRSFHQAINKEYSEGEDDGFGTFAVTKSKEYGAPKYTLVPSATKHVSDMFE